MASPPPKRQRRSKAVISDNEEEDSETFLRNAAPHLDAVPTAVSAARVTTLQKSTKSKSKPSTKAAKAPARKAPQNTERASPNKSKKSPRKTKTEQNIKSLHTFFGRATEAERWTRKADAPTEEIEDVENADTIEDDHESLDETFPQLGEGQDDVNFQLDRRKDRAPLTKNRSQPIRSGLPASTQKFVKPPIARSGRNDSNVELDDRSNQHLHRPWADRYGPANMEELAVHKKKVTDVQRWLVEVLSGRDPRKILVLKGSAGSGKTTSISILSTAMGFRVLHWSNPTVSGTNMTASVASQFDDFVNRSGNFGSLDFDASNLIRSDAKPEDRFELSPRVLVVEEFPTNMTRSSAALESFRAVLLRYLAAGGPASNTLFRKGGTSLETHSPLVLIISESLLTSATASADSFTAHRLLGPEIINHPLVTVMEFNTVAPTIMGKAIDLVIRKEARDSRRRRIPGPALLKKLSEMGDIRSAINALEFLCARSADNDDWSGTVAAKVKKSSKDGVILTPMEKRSLELVTQREATLGMFHAVGKVVYNKREDPQIADPRADLPPKPPAHLVRMHKSEVSQMSIDDLMNEAGTDIPTFVSSLHENYVLSCNGSSFLESCGDCIDALSDSDILGPEGRPMSRFGYGRGPSSNGASNAGGIDVLRQNEICFHVAVRGLLFALPHPVNRAAHPGGRKGDTFKMFYPASLRIWKPMEEIDSLISTLMQHDMWSGLPGPAHKKNLDNGVASWKQKNNAFDTNSEDDETSITLRTLASRADMLFDRLPYQSKIQISKEVDVQKIKQVTQFRGAALQGQDDSEEGGMEAATDLSAADEITDKATMSPKKRDRIIRVEPDKDIGQNAALNKDDVEFEKLYISDDDIMDD